MTNPEQSRQETDAYLARIRKTIADSERLVEAAKLRMAETDRFLEKQGLTREQVMGFRFTGEQREAVNRELVKMGLDPLGDEAMPAPPTETEPPPAPFPPLGAAAGDELAERQKKFGMMMKPFQI